VSLQHTRSTQALIHPSTVLVGVQVHSLVEGGGRRIQPLSPEPSYAYARPDTYGEDLLFCARDEGIYYWDTSVGPSTRAVALSSLLGAASTPTIATQILVSERDRHVIALGCDPESDPGVQDPLVIRFSSQESLTDWEALPTNTAGELRIGTGSHIVCGVQT